MYQSSCCAATAAGRGPGRPRARRTASATPPHATGTIAAATRRCPRRAPPRRRRARPDRDRVDGIAPRGPSDLVFDAQGGGCFTDLGKSPALDRDHGGVFYAAAGGAAPRVAAHPALTSRSLPTAWRCRPTARRRAAPKPLARGGGPSSWARRGRCGARRGRRRRARGCWRRRRAATDSASIRWRWTRWATCAWPR